MTEKTILYKYILNKLQLIFQKGEDHYDRRRQTVTCGGLSEWT